MTLKYLLVIMHINNQSTLYKVNGIVETMTLMVHQAYGVILSELVLIRMKVTGVHGAPCCYFC
jgi:hypothetical protein